MERDQATSLRAYARTSTVESSLIYIGGVMSLLAKGEDTDGRLVFIEFQTKPGNEPPPHVHEWEHELYYVLEGAMEIYCGDKMFVVGPGESVFLPAGRAHVYFVRSPRLRALTALVAAGEEAVVSDRYLMHMGEPVKTMELPVDGILYETDPGRVLLADAIGGLRMLSPEEAAVALPQYPGFGAHLKELAQILS